MQPPTGSRTRREPLGLAMLVMRAWMCLVPIAILSASAAFGAVAALDRRWALLAVMVAMAAFGLALLALHWWLLYRFGATGGER